MANKGKSKGAEAQAQRYKSERKWESNRMAKLERALKRNPENKQIELAMKNIVYRRSTPKTSQWNATKIATAKLFKKFSGKVNMDIFSSNEKVSAPALMLKGKVTIGTSANSFNMFKLVTRAHNGRGNLVWA